MNSVFLIIVGLVLFLYALNSLSVGLKNLAADKLKTFLDRFTNNVFKGIISGIIVTILLDSSSVVIIMTIALVNSKALTFRQAMGIVMGANIGTTFSSQIFALDVGEYAAFPILVGFILMFFFRSNFYTNLGRVIFSFGLIFFGLFTIEEAVAPLKESGGVTNWLMSLDNTWKGVSTGALVTVVVQSSSATMGMVISLGEENLITLAGSIAVMLGAELGTCADTLVASIGRSRASIRTGLFHLAFNVITILLGMMVLPLFTNLVNIISGGNSLQRTIANAHMLFNILGVVLMLPFLKVYESVLERVVPDTSTQPGVEKNARTVY